MGEKIRPNSGGAPVFEERKISPATLDLMKRANAGITIEPTGAIRERRPAGGRPTRRMDGGRPS